MVGEILKKQVEAIGLERVRERANKMKTVATNDRAEVLEILVAPGAAIRELVEVFIDSFPLSIMVLRLQLMRYRTRIPEIGLSLLNAS